MKNYFKSIGYIIVVLVVLSCKKNTKTESKITVVKQKSIISAKNILGNPDYMAMSYGGYRHINHDIEPTIAELKEDMKILAAMGVKIIRTYKVHLPHAANVLKAIRELKKKDSSFEMYVMLGAWIDCKNAWTDLEPDHNKESERNAIEIKETVRLAKEYPDVVKVIAVGNEAMVKWATNYYVRPWVVLKWVNHLQELKSSGELSKDLWITSSDNFASWGGGGKEYHVEDLNELINAVDFLSVHTYPMHDTHYNPQFWKVPKAEESLSDIEKIDAAMLRAKKYAMAQYDSVKRYMKGLGIDKPVHIGETGWASTSNGYYGPEGSKATDEYKEALYYHHMRNWTNDNGISCFYFEGFDEQWKDAANTLGSENHFGLINLKSEAKFALWELVDSGTFEGLTRDGNPITKTYGGVREELMKEVLVPPLEN
ncbi:glycoside hydrolase family 17 protein [Costertonia aggregata]|uniref:Endo-1,3-beta-glucanase btgC n=1 Tax=Costertonia aggregata TaxID=343403 RepID=A0A7H9AS12_9FLAO|nr:glycosyl hydrolase family 17 [Costertonia aggregata]QLG46216.1 glycosyl hydrolase family 17 [Costertonia aggregata]